jgi:hypothetical protein
VQTTPGTSGHLPAGFPQLRCMNGPEGWVKSLRYSALQARSRWFEPTCALPKLSQLDGTFETLIGESGTAAGNHRCMLPGEEACLAAMAASLGHQGAPCSGRHSPPLDLRGAAGSAVSGLAGAPASRARRRPGQSGWEEDGIGARRRKASRARQGCSTHSCRCVAAH